MASDPQVKALATHQKNPEIYERIKKDLRAIIPTLHPGQRIRFREHVEYVTGSQATFYFRKLHQEEPDIAAHLWPLRPTHGKPEVITLSTDARHPLRVWEVAAEATTVRRLDVILANDAEEAAAKNDDEWFRAARATLDRTVREIDLLISILDDPVYRRKVAKN